MTYSDRFKLPPAPVPYQGPSPPLLPAPTALTGSPAPTNPDPGPPTVPGP